MKVLRVSQLSQREKSRSHPPARLFSFADCPAPACSISGLSERNHRDDLIYFVEKLEIYVCAGLLIAIQLLPHYVAHDYEGVSTRGGEIRMEAAPTLKEQSSVEFALDNVIGQSCLSSSEKKLTAGPDCSRRPSSATVCASNFPSGGADGPSTEPTLLQKVLATIWCTTSTHSSQAGTRAAGTILVLNWLRLQYGQ